MARGLVELAFAGGGRGESRAILDAMNRSFAWRLFTPWWKFKELLKK